MLSVPHLVIIFLVALIVFGPEKLPELARTFGRAMSEFKRATGDFRAGFEEHMRELEREATIREAQKKAAEEENKILPPPAASDMADPASVTSESEAASPTLSTDQVSVPETVPGKASNGHA